MGGGREGLWSDRSVGGGGGGERGCGQTGL